MSECMIAEAKVVQVGVEPGNLAWVQHPTLGLKLVVDGTCGDENIVFVVGQNVFVTTNKYGVIVRVCKEDPRI